MSVLRVGNRGLSLGRTLILARILPPEQFGVYGIALILISTLSSLSQVGTSEALIQKPGDMREYLNSAWSIKIVRGLVNFALLWFFAPLVAAFFENPAATYIIRIISASFLFGALGSQAILSFVKELDLKKQFIYESVGTVTDFVVSVSLALWLKSAAALAYGYTAGIAALCLVSYRLHDHRHRFTLEMGKMRELFRFGRWIWLDNVLGLLLSEGVGTAVGRLFGTAALGLYQMGQRMANVLTYEIAYVLGNVTFPLYSKLQDDVGRLGLAYSTVMKAISALVVPIAVIGGIYSTEVTGILLGPLWTAVAPLFRVMVVSGLLISWSTVNHSLLKAVGKPARGVGIRMVRFVVLAAIVMPLKDSYGLLGVAVALLCGLAVSVTLEFALVCGMLKIWKREILRILAFPFLLSLLAGFVAEWLGRGWVQLGGSGPRFLVPMGAALLYALGFWMIDDRAGYGMRRLVLNALRPG